jgi:hypothetical protein
LYDRAAHIAAKDNLSVDEFVSAAIASRVSARETIDAHAVLFDRGAFDRALNKIPDVEPNGSDRI